jgi:hypothetical protein
MSSFIWAKKNWIPISVARDTTILVKPDETARIRNWADFVAHIGAVSDAGRSRGWGSARQRGAEAKDVEVGVAGKQLNGCSRG